MSNARNIADSNLDDLIVDNIYLGGTGDANKLDDYEEGTWTPTGGANVASISSAQGFYTKVGNLVTVSWIATLDPTATSTSMSIGGLPFLVADKISGSQVESTGILFEDHALYAMFTFGGSTTVQVEFDRPMQGSQNANADTYRGTLTYFTT